MRKRLRSFARFCSWIFGLCLLAAIVFFAVASRCQSQFRPVREPVTKAQSATLASIPKYLRSEQSTYLTFPEWYLVFNPQEYAEWLKTRRPSGFPYFTSIAQFWNSYAQMVGIVRREYQFEFGDHLMICVIGTSTTFEYTVKSAYENTMGRFSEWTAGDVRTPEEDYAAKVAYDYGQFVPTKPWFEFPFGACLAEFWRTVPASGPAKFRKAERRFFISLELGFKYLYAGLIRLGSHAVYGVADDEVMLLAKASPPAVLKHPGVRQVQDLNDGTTVLAVPHYQGFTDVMPELAEEGLETIDIAGADEILLSVHAPLAWSCREPGVSVIFEQSLLIDPAHRRVALQVPVRVLGSTLRDLARQDVTVEHLFDY